MPKLGRLKVAEVKRPEIAEMISGMRKTPVAANHTLATLRKMFNLAEIWGWRPDGTNPCRHIQKFGGGKRTRLITDEEMVRLRVVTRAGHPSRSCDAREKSTTRD